MLIKLTNILLLWFSLFGIIGIVLGRILKPNKLWLALLFCMILGPLGQFYVRGGFQYFLIIVMVGLVCNLLGTTENIEIFITIASSIFLMALRFKLESIKRVEQGT